MISRNYQSTFQQCIEYDNILQYFDNLKSRIYKAFFDNKYRSKAYFLQSCFVNSPLVIIMAAVYHARITRLSLNSFELGYVTFSVSNNFFLDSSFYFYYRENFVIDVFYLFRSFVEKIRCLIVTWCIEPYRNYLFSKEGFLFYYHHLSGQNFLKRLANIQAIDCTRVLLFNIRSCFSYFYLPAIIRRLSLHKNIKQYLRKCLSSTAFAYLIFGFDFPIEYTALAKNSISLLHEILKLLFFYVSHEVSTILKTYYVLDDCMKAVSILNSGCVILIIDKDTLRLNTSLKELENFLLFNGVKLKDVTSLCRINLAKAIGSELLSFNVFYEVYPFYLNLRPSLYSQFILMKRISLIFTYSASQPLFLLIVRLNKLLVLWLDLHIARRNLGKIVYLIDYLINLKIKLFAKKQNLYLQNLKIWISAKLYYGNCAHSSYCFCKSNDLIFVFISNRSFCKYYVLASMRWIYIIKCLSN